MKKAMAALILFLIETLLFYLYEMPLEAWAYSSVFILLIFGGWIILDGVQQRKKYKQLKNIQKEAEVYLETEHFGKPENAVEKEYQNLAEMLGRQWENARQEARCQISEANRYYIRWSHQDADRCPPPASGGRGAGSCCHGRRNLPDRTVCGICTPVSTFGRRAQRSGICPLQPGKYCQKSPEKNRRSL